MQSLLGNLDNTSVPSSCTEKLKDRKRDKKIIQTPSMEFSKNNRVEEILSGLQKLLKPHAHLSLFSNILFLTRRRKHKQLPGAKGDRSFSINTDSHRSTNETEGRGRMLHFSLDLGM